MVIFRFPISTPLDLHLKKKNSKIVCIIINRKIAGYRREWQKTPYTSLKKGETRLYM